MIFKPTEEERAIKFLKNLFTKKRHVKIDHIPETKTVQQGRYIWLVFLVIGEETGNTKEDVYYYYLDKFPVYKEIDINGDVRRVQVSMSHDEFCKKEVLSHFIDKVVVDARQEGFIIPDPKDIETRKLYDYYRKKGML